MPSLQKPDLTDAPVTLAGLPEWVAGRYPKSLILGRVTSGEIAGRGSRELRDHVRELALGLGGLGLARGDRMAIISESRPEWVQIDLAAQTLGVIDAPIYPTLSAGQTEYILRDCGARLAVVSTPAQLQKLRDVAPRLPLLETVVVIDPGWTREASDPFATLSYAELAGQGARRINEGWGVVKDYNDAAKLIQPGDLATIIYTSGTTGEPKGVMLTHHNLISNAIASLHYFTVGEEDVALSFLPMSHSFERVASYLYLLAGVTIMFAENMDTIARDLRIVRPTVLTGVPRVYEKLHARILEKGASETGLKKKIFDWAMRVAQEGRPGGLKWKIADRLVLHKVREAVGGRVRLMVSGSAALPAHVGKFFYGCGLVVMEGYGLTETSPVLTVTPPDAVRFGAVGKAIPGVELKIAGDGEILARGPNVMQGYYNKPAETAEVLKDGWFHTGDIGSIDADGYLRITDRKKDLIVTAGGKKIAPQPIEARLKSHPAVAEAIVIGEGRKFPAVLFVPSDPANAHSAASQAMFQAALDDVNRDLGQFEKLKKFGVLPKPLSQEAGELTPTLKVKRKVIDEKYRDVIDRLYDERGGGSM